MSDSQRARQNSTRAMWGETEKVAWFDKQSIKRSYQAEVVTKIEKLSSNFKIVQYGQLAVNELRYPLYYLKNADWQASKPTVLITGGVHGYETSGVQGALRFLETQANAYTEQFNLVVVPCISPWAYETINRWNPYCVDPNRSFDDARNSAEAAALMSAIEALDSKLLMHIDLHETTDTDNSQFMPALDARDGKVTEITEIPDGFYLVGDSKNPRAEFQRYIIEQVSKVTHIAPADEQGRIIGTTLAQPGVINYPVKSLSLCTGFSQARFNTTTEVYPDSPLVDDENCILAQVRAVTAALDYIRNL